MAEDVPENQKTTIDGVGFVEKWPNPFGPHENTPIGTDYQGEGSIELYPQGNDGNKDYHPFELEYHVDDDGMAELRCYYGVIHYSIAAIQTEAFTVSSTKRFGIKSQNKLPGIGTVTPVGFVNQETGATQKFTRYPVGKVGADGSPPETAFGTVYLRFYVDALNYVVKGADINFVEKGGTVEEEVPCGELKKVGDKLLRNPNVGRYRLKIGSFNSPQDTSIPITQSIEDHVYYATTIVGPSADYESSDGDFSDGTIAALEGSSPERFTVDGNIGAQQPDPVVPGPLPRTGFETSVQTPTSNQTKLGPGAVLEGTTEAPTTFDPKDYARNQPDYTTLHTTPQLANQGLSTYYQQQADVARPGFDTTVVPPQEIDGTFGGTGAAGTGGTSDVTGYNTDAATLPDNIESEMEVQLFGPDGSAGGSATSSSYSY